MSMLSELIQAIKMYGLESIVGRYYGIYPAVVEDNKDPKGMGRIQVRSLVFGHEKKVSNWVAPMFSDMMYDPPEIGSDIWIQFIAGDLDRPVYVGGRKPVGNTRFSEMMEETPTIRGFKTAGGQKIIFKDKSGSEGIEISDKNGNSIVLDKNGVKVNGYYIVTEKFLDFMNKHVVDFGLGNLGAPVPLNPAGTAPDFVSGNTSKKNFKTNI